MKKILLFLFLFSFLLRIFSISRVPCSLNWDEVTFGYNAFSILNTLRDEYGELLPLQFKSVGDYKAPMYVYLLVPSVAFFGLNEFSVRFIPALFGSLSVVGFYLIVNSLLNKRIALISAVLLLITPWHLQFTRAGADVGVSTFFVIIGIYFFLEAIYRNKKTYVLSFIFFALSFYSYFADRLFVPLIAISTLFVFSDNVFMFFKNQWKSLLIGFIFVLPILSSLISPGHREKINKTTFLSQQRPTEYVEYLQLYSMNTSAYNIFHSKNYELFMGVFDKYVSHFSPTFLFSVGSNYDGRQMIFRMGLLYLFELPFLLFGITYLLKIKNRKIFYFILMWVLVAPIPASITNDPPHARRSFNMVYPLTLIVGIGFYNFYFKFKNIKWLKFVFTIFISLLFFVNFSFYIASYYVFTPNRTLVGSAGWQWGYKELVSKLEQYEDQYSKIVVDTSYQGPYIYFLFYKKYPPYLYQPQAELIQDSPLSLGEGRGFDKYEFRPIYWPDDRKTDGILFAGPIERIPLKDIDPKESNIIDTIYFPNGDVAYLIVETN